MVSIHRSGSVPADIQSELFTTALGTGVAPACNFGRAYEDERTIGSDSVAADVIRLTA